MTDGLVFVQLEEADYYFITRFDPDRDRSASRQDMVDVVYTVQSLLIEGRVG